MTSGSTTSTSGAVNRGSGAHEPSYTGRAVRRFEDADLLRGHGRFGDDLPVRPDTLHAAILRSPHAHAEILSVDGADALAVPGVDCVVTSEDARRWTRPFRRRRQDRNGAMVPRHRPGALRRRAGCGGVGAQPRYRRGCARADCGRIPAVAADRGSRGGGPAGCAAAPSGGRLECDQRTGVPLRRSRDRLCRSRASDFDHDELPAQFRHADRMLCRDRRVFARRRGL